MLTREQKMEMARKAGFQTGTRDMYDCGALPYITTVTQDCTVSLLAALDAAYQAGLNAGIERGAALQRLPDSGSIRQRAIDTSAERVDETRKDRHGAGIDGARPMPLACVFTDACTGGCRGVCRTTIGIESDGGGGVMSMTPKEAATQAPAQPDNVVQFRGGTRLDLEPDDVLENLKGRLSGFIYAGYDLDGNQFFGSTYGSTAESLLLMERFKRYLLDNSILITTSDR